MKRKKKIFLKEKLSLYFLAIIKKKLAVLVAENFWIPMLMFPSIKVVSWKLMIHIYLLASSIRDTGFIFFQLLMWQTPNTEILENVSAKRFISYWNSKLHHVQLKITNIQEIHETCWLYMFKKGILLSIFYITLFYPWGLNSRLQTTNIYLQIFNIKYESNSSSLGKSELLFYSVKTPSFNKEHFPFVAIYHS